MRSAASTKRVGAFMLAATVCPASTLREITIPSIGARWWWYPRLTRWLLSCAGLDHGSLRGLELGLRRLDVDLGGLEVCPGIRSLRQLLRRSSF